MKKLKMGQSPKRKPSIKKYTGMIVISSTIGMVVSAFFIQFIGNIVGFGCNDVLIIFFNRIANLAIFYFVWVL